MAFVELEVLVNEWLSLDPNPDTREEIQNLWEGQNLSELEKRLRNRIEFGTAGLRAKMEAGWARMNDLTIIQTSLGLSEYVSQHVEAACSRGVVIGYDHRHHSESWALLTAHTFSNRGYKVYLLRGLNHTPLVPFSVKTLNSACGVMITASHNPKQDNGYKVYWENAVQIIAPHDRGISEAINLVHKNYQSLPQNDHSFDHSFVDFTQKLQNEYFEYLQSIVTDRHLNSSTKIKFVNTSMHGVSDSFVKKAFIVFGFPSYIPVEEQQYPDPEFSTVQFPNPEEKGALNLALKLAENSNANFVLAQDPDGDRFIAAERSNTEWTYFTGDQLGSLFADRVLQIYKSLNKPINKLAMVASTVSSKMIATMAKIEGFKFVECLTGFKFIGNTAILLENQGFEVKFGYEEAIGFMFGSQIRDKDGVAATMIFAEMAASLYGQNKTMKSHLLNLYQRYGYFQTKNGYFSCMDSTISENIFFHLRNYNINATSQKLQYPTLIAGFDVNRIVDLTIGYDSDNPPDYLPLLPLSSGQFIQFRAFNSSSETNLVLTLRTSGTEPKIKFYLECNGKNFKAVDQLLSKAVVELSEIWIPIAKYNIEIS